MRKRQQRPSPSGAVEIRQHPSLETAIIPRPQHGCTSSSQPQKGNQHMSRTTTPPQRLKATQPAPQQAQRAKRTQAEAQPAATSLLKDQQVMSLLGISRTGLHYLMRKQGLPYIKLGEGSRAALRFSEHSLQLWLKEHEHQAVS